MFIVISALLIIVQILTLMHVDLKRKQKDEKRYPTKLTRAVYITGLFRGFTQEILILSKKPFKMFWNQILHKISIFSFKENKKWIIIGLNLSFLYLAASGFIFALFIRRSLFGYPLLFHVVAGGVFGICLAFFMVYQGKNYMISVKKNKTSSPPSKQIDQTIQSIQIKKALFWIFVGSGFMLITTALLSMTSLLPTKSQIDLSSLHKYSALASLLSAWAFVFFTRVENEK